MPWDEEVRQIEMFAKRIIHRPNEDVAGARTLHAPASPLVIRCTNPTCQHEENYYGRGHSKFRVESR